MKADGIEVKAHSGVINHDELAKVKNFNPE
jgi:hypothetical protein